MIVLAGTVPYQTGIYVGDARIEDDFLRIGNTPFPIERGTAAMASACARVCQFYSLPLPFCIFGGDIADGKGTDLMFRELNNNLDRLNPDVVTLHYLFPKIAHGQPFINKINSLPKKPQLIADAGGMYLMKTLKQASFFDVFTPDRGELAFLADEFAPHPLYVRREIISRVNDIDTLVATAYRHRDAAKTLVIKGAVDYIFYDGIKVKECRDPNIPAMEAVGGTGDTVTGLLTAFRSRNDEDADYKALVINRLIGQFVRCTPATQIKQFIAAIPAVLEEYEKHHS
jgi:NAD(P)H-hydrate repair Nnr-like enzyme with NAD(P)H-hydrate dehydratase domain